MKKLTAGFLATLAILAVIGCQNGTEEDLNDRIIACPEDAKICSDGTILTRQGEMCEFPACPDEDTSTEATDSEALEE